MNEYITVYASIYWYTRVYYKIVKKFTTTGFELWISCTLQGSLDHWATSVDANMDLTMYMIAVQEIQMARHLLAGVGRPARAPLCSRAGHDITGPGLRVHLDLQAPVPPWCRGLKQQCKAGLPPYCQWETGNCWTVGRLKCSRLGLNLAHDAHCSLSRIRVRLWQGQQLGLNITGWVWLC